MSNHKKTSELTCSIVSLGCPKNLTDSEIMIGKMLEAGFLFCEEATDVDVVILNTCGFLNDARNEARDVLETLIADKHDGLIKKIWVTGCAVQWEREKLVEMFPDVDLWFGVFDEFHIGDIAKELCESKTVSPQSVTGTKTPRFFVSSEQKSVFDDSPRHRLTLPHVAYLKIADGCSRHCAYCLIPKIRGPFVSRPKDLILNDAKQLASEGVREIVVIAQETNFWGLDLYGKPMLAELLTELQQIDHIKWLRLMYTYPMYFDDALIELFVQGGKNNGKLLPYIDIPLQHCNDEILRKMNRKANKAETENLLGRLRDQIPNLVLRTSLITGFPGETDAMFDELLAFVDQWQFERAGVFKYSQEDGTIAAQMPNQIDETLKQERYMQLSARTEAHTIAWAKRQIGKIFDVLIDQREFDEQGRLIPNVFIGRTYADAPTVDPVVYVTVQSPQHSASNKKTFDKRSKKIVPPTTSIVPGDTLSCEVVANHGINILAIPQ